MIIEKLQKWPYSEHHIMTKLCPEMQCERIDKRAERNNQCRQWRLCSDSQLRVLITRHGLGVTNKTVAGGRGGEEGATRHTPNTSHSVSTVTQTNRYLD